MAENEGIKTLKIILANNSIGMENKQEVLEVAIQALEKQIPKKPLIKKDTYNASAYYCKNCDCYIRSTMTRKEIILEENAYCGSCGQKLNWNGDEEYDD